MEKELSDSHSYFLDGSFICDGFTTAQMTVLEAGRKAVMEMFNTAQKSLKGFWEVNIVVDGIALDKKWLYSIVQLESIPCSVEFKKDLLLGIGKSFLPGKVQLHVTVDKGQYFLHIVGKKECDCPLLPFCRDELHLTDNVKKWDKKKERIEIVKEE